jgi:multimeric flavodoxin WrbA
MMNVIGLAGSPRRNGNSTTLLRAAVAGSESAGAQAQVVYLNDLTFHGCQACGRCDPDDTCRIDDDLSPVLADLRQARIWILAAPIYFDGVSGQMKSFFDRCYHLTYRQGRIAPQLKGPRAGAVIVTYEDKPRDDYYDVAKRLAGYLKWMGDFEPVEIVSEGNLGPAGAAGGRPELLTRAREMGSRLVEQLAAGSLR